jgi:hypothetical protein
MEGAAMSITSTSAALVVKLCGLFSSEHAGERASAAAKADAIIRQHGLTWPDVIRPAPAHEVKLRICVESDAPFNDWERGFLRGIAGQPKLSEKQQAALDRLYAKVRR